MPYQKRSNKKSYKKSYKKPQEQKMHSIARLEAKKVIKQEIESKHYDTVSSSSVSTTMTSLNLTSGLTRGTGTDNYIGSKIRPTHLTVRLQFNPADNTNILRLLILQDKSISGIPVAGTIYSNTSYPWLSPLNDNFIESYTPLYDKVHILKYEDVGNNVGAAIPRYVKVKIPFSKLRGMSFKADNTNETGALWLTMISDSGALSHPTYAMISRLHFRDA